MNIRKNSESMNTTFIIAGAAVVTLVICIIFFLPDNKTTPDILELEDKIVQMERKIIALEEQAENRRQQFDEVRNDVRAITQNFETFQAMPVEIEKILNRIENMDKRQGNLEKKVSGSRAAAPAPVKKVATSTSKPESKPAAKTPAKTAAKKTAASGGSATKYYTVHDGETLYSIARRHGLNVDQLLKMNGLSRNTILQPGQKLAVGQ